MLARITDKLVDKPVTGVEEKTNNWKIDFTKYIYKPIGKCLYYLAYNICYKPYLYYYRLRRKRLLKMKKAKKRPKILAYMLVVLSHIFVFADRSFASTISQDIKVKGKV